MRSLAKNMNMRVAIGAVRLGHRPQQLLLHTADRRSGDPRLLIPFSPRMDRGLLRAQLFQGQETIGQHHQAGVVMKSAPRAALEVCQTQLLLHLLVALLHRPAGLSEPNRFDTAGPCRQVRETILDLAVGPLLDQQPDRSGARTGAFGPTLARPDADPGELRRPLPL